MTCCARAHLQPQCAPTNDGVCNEMLAPCGDARQQVRSKADFAQGHFLSLPQPLSQAHVLNMCFRAFATRCWLHMVSRANRCDQKLILPIPVSKVSCHLANKMSANVWRTSYVDQYDTTCCGHVSSVCLTVGLSSIRKDFSARVS